MTTCEGKSAKTPVVKGAAFATIAECPKVVTAAAVGGQRSQDWRIAVAPAPVVSGTIQVVGKLQFSDQACVLHWVAFAGFDCVVRRINSFDPG